MYCVSSSFNLSYPYPLLRFMILRILSLIFFTIFGCMRIPTIIAVIDNLKAEQSEVENVVDNKNLFLTSFGKYENINKLTREILFELVDHIKIYEGADISIKFIDEYRRVVWSISRSTRLTSQKRRFVFLL